MEARHGQQDIPALEESTRDYVVWPVEAMGISVLMSLELVDRLSREVLEGYKAIPKRGLEIGGVLLGRVDREAGAPAALVIEAAEQIPSEHRNGPSYLLSESDLQKLAARMTAGRKAPLNGLEPIGFFRSHTRDGAFSLDIQDVEIMERWFHAPANAFLLIQPADRQRSRATIFLHGHNGMRKDAADVEFAFHRGALEAAGYPVRRIAAAAENKPAAEEAHQALVHHQAVQTEIISQPSRTNDTNLGIQGSRISRLKNSIQMLKARGAKRNWVALAAALTVLTAALALWALLRQHRSEEARLAGRLSLSVARENGALRLRWNRTAPSVLKAKAATLWIMDGAEQRRLELDIQQLRTGSITYWPGSVDVNFRMELHEPDRSTAESVRSVGAPPLQPAVAAEAAKLAGAGATQGMAERTQRKPRRFESTELPGEVEAGQPARLPEPSKTDSAVMLPPPERPSPFTPAIPAPLPSSVQPKPPASVPSAVTVSVARPEKSKLGRVVGRIPLLRRLRRERPEALVPPRPLQQVMPSVSPELVRRMHSEMLVGVRVYVNETGHVEYAEPVSEAEGMERELSTLAVYAARKWRFAPARVNDQAAPSELVLQFRFAAPRLAAR